VICKLTSLFLILVLTCTAFAQGDTGVLSGTGSVYLNGAQLTTASLAVANGDVIQPKDAGVANLKVAGSTVTIESNTIVRFQSGGLALDRGSISVASGRGLVVFARDFKITPASGSWTEFYVSRASGVIQVLARTNNVTINCGTNGSSTVKQGQQISREDAANCGLVAKVAGATPAAKGPILDSAWARDAGLVTGGALLLWVLTKCEDPVSPSSPTAHC